MRRTRMWRWAGAAIGLALFTSAGIGTAAGAPTVSPAAGQPATYVLDFVATAASGIDVNDLGDVIGTSRLDNGCGSTCLPPEDTVVWRSGQRIVLPNPTPSLTPIVLADINNNGWITGYVGVPGLTTHAVVWKPSGTTYTAIDIGALPGHTISTANAIDDLNRVVGCSTPSASGCASGPFLWTEAGGIVSLTSLGFPAEAPCGMSPGGTVATSGYWYRLGDPGSVTSMPPPPPGFGAGCTTAAINDAGDQARFLGIPLPEFLDYPFRFHHEGTWQQLSSIPTGHLSSAGVGSINAAGDITLTVAGAGMIAYGPDGVAQSLSALVAPSYGGSVLTGSGPMNASGQILAEMIIGQSGRRIVRLVPATPCAASCIRVTSMVMQGKGPGSCPPGQAQAKVTLTVTSETGAVLSGARVTGHFFDDYWLDQIVTGRTNTLGQVSFKHAGPCGVGAIAFLVTAASMTGRTFDETTGILTKYVIPLP